MSYLLQQGWIEFMPEGKGFFSTDCFYQNVNNTEITHRFLLYCLRYPSKALKKFTRIKDFCNDAKRWHFLASDIFFYHHGYS